MAVFLRFRLPLSVLRVMIGVFIMNPVKSPCGNNLEGNDREAVYRNYHVQKEDAVELAQLFAHLRLFRLFYFKFRLSDIFTFI